VGDIRDRLRAAIATIEQFADGKFELHLRPPATEAKLQEAEREFGHRLPGDLRELYLLHDGQAQLLSTASLFLGEPFASLDRALAVWRHMVNFHGLEQGKPPIEQPWPAAAPELRSVEHDILWFPFAVLEDEMKTAYWVDLNPVEGRPLGQVIEEGPWAHPPQYVGSSVLELLETIAEYAGSDQMTTLPTYGFVSWGFGPNHSGPPELSLFRR
jgi:cell wall assembly regulator SMI1